MLFQRRQRTSERFVLVKKDLVIKDPPFTELFLHLCARVVTLQTIMELEENRFMAVDFQMKIFYLSMKDLVFSQWPMQDPTQMDLNSSSALQKQTGWMENMLFLGT